MARPAGAYQVDSLRSRIADLLDDGIARLPREVANALGEPLERTRNCLYCGMRDRRFLRLDGRYTLPKFEPPLGDAPKVVIRAAQAGEVSGQARQWWQT